MAITPFSFLLYVLAKRSINYKKYRSNSREVFYLQVQILPKNIDGVGKDECCYTEKLDNEITLLSR
jgi:hypothetical protein